MDNFIKNNIDDVIDRLMSIADKKICLLYGDIGSGKTTFVKRYLENLQIVATSPTFNICNQYADQIFHFDLYRVDCSTENLENIGFFHGLNGSLVFVEWAENLSDITIYAYKQFIYKLHFTHEKITFL